MLADLGNGRLQFAGECECVRVDGGDSQASALVEADGIEVVVGGDQPEAVAAAEGGIIDDGVEQPGADSLEFREGIKGNDLTVVVADFTGDEADTLS